ncbi:HAD family hydrolase [Facklamia miroungae]|uniref:Haloacid dehalogenase superfamily, subfamily IA, variant 3 with third motif having DD or ED/haloacid dehalogenase superfamily, subfamily IA, variant 1 with third motif having Dx(3-4)D or Dx(3-4)E n=1 Tax=Facklamia miroungae TaxID=120956 RepID=A0A1G7UEC1_9LACT|nr:HAD family phosphatase [Facklamia miroungae]NKZ30072.1 HAD family phosphatase [Facklamia miroungae]SDG45631.1 haloacid dehalogenase superfamily, subfamily IA, variant 3 with third motif having DD or ED/haloacid dehalogenase superfamily, subfamily IA, variant 1 with third motif having Dx(3-4)D or Dx(3-4)E [Facklamia miroungae]
MEKFKLFIFDMDGLMFETGQLAYRSYLKAAEKHDYEVTPSVYYYLTGRNDKEIRKEMKDLYGNDKPTDEWRNSINHFKKEILAMEQRVYKKKGLNELLNDLHQYKIHATIASSSNRQTINYYLEIEKLSHLINTIVAGDEVTQSKPHPEIFLRACEKSGFSPSQALVFEDSSVGIEAAQKAGIKSVLIEDDITFLPDFHGKHKLLKDLSNERKNAPDADYKFRSLLEAKQFFFN